MLTLIEGGFSSCGFDEIKKRILLSHQSGRRAFLIVPEQQTVIAEDEMTDFMPKDAPLYFEVTNFTRLANTAFRALGGIAGEYCDKTKKTLIMWRALGECSPLLKCSVDGGEVSASSAEKYLLAISEMQSAGIGPDELIELAESEAVSSDARLKSKLEDLSCAMSAYKRLLGERYADTADDIGNMLIKLDEHPEFLSDTDIYIDGFTSFTDGQYKLIGKLSARSNVTASLIIPRAQRDAFEYGETMHTHERLVSYASRENAEVKLLRIDGKFGRRHELLYEIIDKLWHSNAKFDNSYLQNPEVLRIFASQTPFEMCDFLCADIKRRVSSGAKYSDFAVVLSSADAYDGILDMSFEKYGIPAFTSHKRSTDEFSAVKLIYSAYRAIRSRFSREDLLSYAKCAFCGIDPSDVDAFEVYVNKWRIDRARFTDGLYWSMNPSGYTDRLSDRDTELLKKINDVKKRLTEPLCALNALISDCGTVREHAVALVKFLSELDIEGQLNEKARELTALGELGEAQEYSSLWKTVCQALDALVEALGDVRATEESFPLLLKIVFSGIEVGRIPSYSDEVTVGRVDMLRLYGKRHIYLLGVNEGELPAAASSEGSYFGAKDRELLALSGVDLNSSDDIKNARELFCFLRAVSYAEESVTMLYSELSAGMKAQNPSDAVNRLISLGDGKINVQKTYEINPAELIFTPMSALDALGLLGDNDYKSLKGAMNDVGYGDILGVAEASITNDDIALSPDMTGEIYGDKLRLSQSKIDTYVDCPMKYFCRYNLKLDDNEIYEFDARSIGTFIHAILESFFRTLRVRGIGVSTLDDAERDKIIRAAAEEYLSSIDGISTSSELFKTRIERLIRAARPVIKGLCEEFSECEFTPAFFEMSLSDRDDSLPELPTFKTDRGVTVKISGMADRVDVMKSGKDVYVRIVDYKTGGKDFSAEDMENKRNLQMFLYLKAVCESDSKGFRDKIGVESDGKILPAGVIYVSTDISDVKVSSYDEQTAEEAVKKQQKRQGMLLDDEISIGGMNKKFIPIKFKGGEIDEASRRLLYSLDGWGDIMATVERAVCEVSDKICSGHIAPVPEKDKGRNPCEYCNYKAICRRASY